MRRLIEFRFALALAVGLAAWGVQGQEWPTRKSIGVAISQGNGSEGCPVVVTSVWPRSPANEAGIQAGDRLLSVDGTPVATSRQATELIRKTEGDLKLDLWRAGRTFEVSVGTEPMADILRRVNKKITPEGYVMALDADQAELDLVRNFNPERIAQRVFPLHIPLSENVYAAGFEVFLLRDPSQVVIGGIDEGPASEAGVRWGDVLRAIDGVEAEGKTPNELEALLSGPEPRRVRLTLVRAGKTKSVEFMLERVSEILRRNQRQLVQGQVVALGLAKEDLRCFLRAEHGNP